MTTPIAATDTATALLELAGMLERTGQQIGSALRYHKRNPATSDALQAALEIIDELAVELATWRIKAGGAVAPARPTGCLACGAAEGHHATCGLAGGSK